MLLFGSSRIPLLKSVKKPMPSLNGRRRISLFKDLFVLVTLYALLLSFCGPALDHHYAERQSNHVHIYLGHVIPNHVHPYEASHAHFYTQVADGKASGYAPLSDKVSNDIVYLSSYDGVGQVFTPLTVPSIHLTLHFPEPGDNHFTFGAAGDDTLYQEAFIAPPKKSPRV